MDEIRETLSDLRDVATGVDRLTDEVTRRVIDTGETSPVIFEAISLSTEKLRGVERDLRNLLDGEPVTPK